MLGITEKYNQFKESTYFTGRKFVIYSLGIYLAATFTVGCLGLIIGSPLLTFPLAMLISSPVVWILMGIVLTAIYKVAVQPLFYLAKDFINGKRASKEGNSPEKQRLTKSESLDSRLDTTRQINDPDRRRRNSYSPSVDSGISISSTKSEQPKQTKVVRYNTAGDGNCFFHAVFGEKKDDSSSYRAERAQDMRLEWHRFLSKFTSLDDASMPAPLKAQLGKVFNMFLNKPRDLTGKSDTIKELAEQTVKKLKEVKERVEQLKKELVANIKLTENEVVSNLKEYAKQINQNLTEDEYNKTYNSEAITNSFLDEPKLYQAYLEATKSQNYFIFIEEVPILASLANIEIDVHYKSNNNDVHTVFKPNPEMINEDYQKNSDSWGDKEQETIYLGGNHYERAEIVEVTPSILEKTSSVVQTAAAACANALGLQNNP